MKNGTIQVEKYPIVQIGSFPIELIHLEFGVDGKVKELDDKFYLEGDFLINLYYGKKVYKTDYIKFYLSGDKKCEVRPIYEGVYEIVSIGIQNFKFKDRIFIKRLDVCMSLENIQVFKNSDLIFVRFLDLGISLTKKVIPLNQNQLVFEESGGSIAKTRLHYGDLSEKSEIGNKKNYYLTTRLNSSANLGIFNSIHMYLPSYTNINFQMMFSSQKEDILKEGLEFSSYSENDPIILSAKVPAVTALFNNQIDFLDDTFLNVRNCGVSKGHIFTKEFAEKTVKIARVINDTTKGYKDSISSEDRAENCQFIMPIEKSSVKPKFDYISTPKFVFKNTLDLKSQPEDRYFGVKISGLESNRGALITLDSSYTEVSMISNTMVNKDKKEIDVEKLLIETDLEFHIKSGLTGFYNPITELEEVSFLLPKYDPSDKKGQRFRSFTIPVGMMGLECRFEEKQALDSETLKINTSQTDETQRFIVPKENLRMISPPLGTSAKLNSQKIDVENEGDYDLWKLKISNKKDLFFKLKENGLVYPEKGKQWLEDWESIPDVFSLAEHPGLTISIDKPSSTVEGALGIPSDLKTVVTGDENAIRNIAYVSLAAYLSYELIPGIKDWSEDLKERGKALIDEQKLSMKLQKLNIDNEKEWVKKNNLGDLITVFHGNSVDKIKEFVDNNMVSLDVDRKKNHSFYWPFVFGLGIVLFKNYQNKPKKYGHEISKEKWDDSDPGMAFDFSNKSSIKPEYLGWVKRDWETFASNAPQVWPRQKGLGDKRKRTGSKADPSVPSWKGFMFREMPLELILPSKIHNYIFEEEKGSKPDNIKYKRSTLANLYNGINDNLKLEYAWLSENKWSGSAGAFFTKADEEGIERGLKLTPDALDKTIGIELLYFSVQIASGKTVRSEGEIQITLPWLEVKKLENGNEIEEPFVLSGKFVLVLNGDDAGLKKIELVPKNSNEYLKTDIIPGIKKIKVKRIITDLKTLQANLELYPDEKLIDALPSLKGNRPFDVTFSIPLKGDGPAILAMSIPAEIETNLFNLFSAKIRNLKFLLELGGEKRHQLVIENSVNLGILGFNDIGGRFILTRDNSNWDLDYRLDKISGAFGIGDFSINGALEWADLEVGGLKKGPVKRDEISETAKKRDLWGSFKLNSGGFFGENKLIFRVASKGEASFWIGSIYSSKDIPLGAGKLKKPAIVIAKNSDFSGKKLLSEVLLNAKPDTLKEKLRPPKIDNVDADRKWLKNWDYSEEVGLVIAASGFLELHKQTVAAPKKDEDLSSLIVTDSGLMRVDGHAKLFNAKTFQFYMAIDLQRKRFQAGIQLPKIKFDGGAVNGGYLELGFGWGENLYFLMSIGWPELKKGSNIERNWDKSVMVQIDGCFPINTFWGGVRVEYDESRGILYMGIAARAGWTKSYSWGNKVVSANAELGVAIGGVIEFLFSWNEKAYRLETLYQPPLLYEIEVIQLSGEILEESNENIVTSKDEDLLIAESMAAIEESLYEIAEIEKVDVTGTLYLDVWGNASAKLFGKTLASVNLHAYVRARICGGYSKSSKKVQINRIFGIAGFTFTVKIGCFSYSASSELTVWLKRGPECKSVKANTPLFLK